MWRVAVATLVAVSVVACTSSDSSVPATTSTTSTTTSTLASASATRPTTVTNVPVSGELKFELVGAFTSASRLDPGYVDGTSGTVYAAFDPATDSNWALASMKPSAAARATHQQSSAGGTTDPLIAFQDGPFVFQQTGDGPWTKVADTGGVPCPPVPPAAVLQLWGIDTAGACG